MSNGERGTPGLAEDLPIELLRPDAKYRVINYIDDLHIHTRIGRAILQSWAVAVGVELTASDFDLVEKRQRVIDGWKP